VTSLFVIVRTGPDAGTVLEVGSEPFVLGRQRGCDMVVRDERASRRHAELRVIEEAILRVTDLDSANGTYVEGERITQADLAPGKELRIGDVVFRVAAEAPEDPLTPAPPTRIDRPGELRSEREREPAGAGSAGGGAQPWTSGQGNVATQSMVRRMVDSSAKSARRTSLLAAGIAAVAILILAGLALTGTLGGGGDDVPAVVARVSPSTVLVQTARQGTPTGTGSGWVLDAPKGLIVTNAHVANQGEQYTVAVGGKARPATLQASAPCEDLAVLKVTDTGGLRPAVLGSDASVAQGETVVALGFAANSTPEDPVGSTRGVVSGLSTAFRDPAPDVPAYPDVIQTDTALNPGNSGGPLVDLEGRLVGVNSAARTSGSDGRPLQNVNYAIRIDRVKRILRDLGRGRSLGYVGLALDYPEPSELAEEGLPSGVRIVGAGTAVEGERLVGELLAGIDGQAIAAGTLDAYCKVAADLKPGGEVVLNIATPGEEQTREVRVRVPSGS